MSIEEKAKAYDEALEKVKPLYERAKKDDSPIWATYEHLFPQLAESEDERIRQEMIHWLKGFMGEAEGCGYTQYEINERIAYLERQKEQKSKEPDWCHHKVDLSGCSEEYMKAYYDGWNNCNQQHSQCKAEQKPAEWKPQPESLEALMYAIEGEWEKIKPTSYLSRRLEDLYEGLVNTFNVDESLIIGLPKIAYSAKDIEGLKVLKQKIDASMEQKPGEIPPYVTGIKGEPDPAGVWKPSEEQMRAVFDASERNDKLGSVLSTLYNDLKKL